MEPILRDIRVALRRLRLTPGFSLFAVASLALGIGVSTAIYSAVRTLLWMPLGVAEPTRALTWADGGRVLAAVSWPDFLDLRAEQSSFSSVAAARQLSAAVAIGDTVETAFGETVSGDYFTTLGVTALRGRLLQPQDEVSAARVAVVSETFWRTRLHADPAVVGRTCKVGGETFEIVGVTRGPFHGAHGIIPAVVWIPEPASPDVAGTGLVARVQRDRALPSFSVWGRLKPGVTIAQARAEASVIAQRLDVVYPLRSLVDASTTANPKPRAWSLRAGDEVAAESDRLDALASAIVSAVAALLLIACTNLANLALAKATSRAHETSVRTALGASRWRLIREQLIESGIVTFSGGALGLVLLSVLVRLFESDLPIAQNIVMHFKPEVNGRVLAASAGATILAFLVFAVWPALQSTREDVRHGLGAGAAATPTRWRLHRALVAWQVGGAVAMVLVAAMSVKVIAAVSSHDSGVDYEHLALAQVNFAVNGKDEPRARALLDTVVADVRRQDGVEHVGASTGLPFGVMPPPVFIAPLAEPFTDMRDSGEHGYLIAGTPDLFPTLGMQIVRGRGFTDRDDAGAPRVAILSEGIARAVFRTTDVVGQTILLNSRRRLVKGRNPDRCTVVGVSKDTDTFILGRRGNPVLFVPFAQRFDTAITITVRSRHPVRVAGVLRSALRRADPELAVSAVGTGSGLLLGPYFVLRIIAGLASGLGGAALILAMAGLHGVLSHLVARRTREMGIRLALGADRPRIFSLILRDGCRPVVTGLALGLFAGLALRIVLRATVLTDISPVDVAVFSLVPIPFLLAALIASCVPASRASRVDPNVALRDL